MPERLPLTVLDRVIVERLEQRQQPLQTIGQGALRHVQPLRAQVLQQAVGRAVEQGLIEQHGDPDRGAQDTLGDYFGGRWCGDDARMSATGAGGTLASPPVEPAMGADLDLQHGGVVGAGEGSGRQSAPGATPLFRRQFQDLLGGGEVGVVTAFGPRPPSLLSAGPWRSPHGGWAVGGGRRIGLASEELLFEGPDAGLELLVLLVEELLALDGPLVHGLPVGGPAPGLELRFQTWAARARSQGGGGSRTGRGVVVPSQEGDRRGVRPGGRRRLNRHAAGCNRRWAGKPESRTGLPKLYYFCWTNLLNPTVWGRADEAPATRRGRPPPPMGPAW